MPEIAEAARIVHFLRAHLVGKRIKKVVAIDDGNVFGKAGTTGDAFAASVTGKKVVSAGSQGKYFWIVLDSPPHPVMHFGMTGWIHIKGMRTAYTNYYNKMKPGDADLWPPKFWKFQLETDSDPKIELAFTDPRRFGRVRLVDCPGEKIRKFSPLAENGPDPVVDADIFTEQFVADTMRKRHVPIKALLLDQAFISGIGNWVGDEVLFQAKLHPEQYCDDFSDAQIKTLYNSICHVCRTAVKLLGDSDQFPDDWLFHYRWGKGSKNSVAQLPNGQKLAFLTVGGRTSCYAPALQKKSGSVAPGAKEEPVVIKEEKPSAPKASKVSKAPKTKKVKSEPEEGPPEELKQIKKRRRGAPAKEEEEVATPTPGKKAKTTKKSQVQAATAMAKALPVRNSSKASPAEAESSGRRRSARVAAK